MRIDELKHAPDEYAMRLAQGRTFSHVTRNTQFTWFKGESKMSLKEKLAAKAAALKSKKNGTTSTQKPDHRSTKKAAAAKNGKAKTTRTRGDIPWAKIKALYEQDKSTAEISDALGLTRKKTKDGKKDNPYPYYLTVGYLTKLAKGVEVDGKKLSIKRGR